MRCPGQDMRFWRPGDIFETECPKCERKVEFFKDEVRRRCRCGHEMVNPKLDLGCAEWCPYAEQCVGAVPEEVKAKRRADEKDLLKEKMCLEMKKHFGTDYRHVTHALKVARYAEKILKTEGGDPVVVLGAAYLHGIGSPEAADKGEPSDGDGPSADAVIAQRILKNLDIQEKAASAINNLISSLRQGRPPVDLESQILQEAHGLASLEDDGPSLNGEGTRKMIEETFKTRTGRLLAEERIGVSRHQ